MAATDRMQNDGVVMSYLWQQQTGCRMTGGNELPVAATDRMQNDGVVMNYLWQQQTGCRMTGW